MSDTSWMSVDGPVCGRCYLPKKDLVAAPCKEKPELKPKGTSTYHCPECGGLLVPGAPHPEVCKECAGKAASP